MSHSLSWHPQWLVYRHQELGMVLMSESKTLWLAQDKFPGLSLIDDQRSAIDINMLLCQQGEGPHQGAMFLYQLEQLQRAQTIIATDDRRLEDYCPNTAGLAATWLMQTEQIIEFS